MTPVFADFNARSEAGNLRLGCPGSQEDLRDSGIQVGDWMWLSDGELVIGAQLAVDEIDGPVGIPRWQTLVHLDDEDTSDVPAAWEQLLRLPQTRGLDPATETRIFQLLTILERVAPPPVKASLPLGYFALRRAEALDFLGEPALARIEREDARRSKPDAPKRNSLTIASA